MRAYIRRSWEIGGRGFFSEKDVKKGAYLKLELLHTFKGGSLVGLKEFLPVDGVCKKGTPKHGKIYESSRSACWPSYRYQIATDVRPRGLVGTELREKWVAWGKIAFVKSSQSSATSFFISFLSPDPCGTRVTTGRRGDVRQ